jgi:hypothetical protein
VGFRAKPGEYQQEKIILRTLYRRANDKKAVFVPASRKGCKNQSAGARK